MHMKDTRKLIAAVFVAIFAFAGCEIVILDGRSDPENYFATIESFSANSSTAAKSVTWSSEDRIAIFDGNNICQAYQILDSYAGKNSGEFSQVDSLTADIATVFDRTIAVYPFDENLNVTEVGDDSYEITGVTFPSEQRYVAGSFSDEAFPMTALTPTGSKDLSFKNIGGVIKLSLTGSHSVSQLILTGNSGEPLSGSATVTLGSNGIPSVEMSDDASTSVTLICDPAVQLDPEIATDFYISIPPTQFEAGFKVTILDEDGKEHGVATHKDNSVKRSTILALPETTPESLDDIVLTADMFCSVDFIEGWTETRFGGDGTMVFVKEDEQGRMTHTLMFLPDEENILMPVYIRYDENEIPSYMSFMDTEIYIDGYTDSTIDFTLAVKDAVWSVKDVPCSELVPYSLQTRAWADNNGIRNACAIGNCIVGALDIGLGVLLIGGAVVVEGGSVGLATPAAVPTIAAGLVQIGAGCKSLNDGFSTIFGPADQKRDPYIANMIIDSSLEGLAQFLEHIEVKENPIIQNFPKEITEEAKLSGKIGLASFIAGMSMAAIDAKWGETYTGPATLAEVHQEVQVVTGRADNITTDSAELYGYVSPLATAPFGDRILTEIYIVLWKVGDENNKQNRSIFNSDGGTVSFTFIHLESDTEYCYQTIFEDLENKKYRFGEVNTFKTKGEPDCITGNASSITTTSAVVECTFSNVPEDGQCQVLLSWDEGHRVINAEKREGTQSITLSALKPNTTYSYCASIEYEGGPVNGEMKEFTTKEENKMPPPTPGQWVDLGLSVLWAGWNVGASSPEEYGGHYAWGETEVRNDYTRENYKFYNPLTNSFYFIGNEISGTSYDVAHVKWGDGARMPTLAELYELVAKCTFTTGSYKGVIGDYVTGPNGNSIFLPFAGIDGDGSSIGSFWSGTYVVGLGGNHAYDLLCSENWGGCGNLDRYYGHSVRPVKKKGT